MSLPDRRAHRVRRGVVLVVALALSPLLAEAALRMLGNGYDPTTARLEARRMIASALGVAGGEGASVELASGAGGVRAVETRGDRLGREAGGVLHPYLGFDNELGLELFERYVRQHREEPERFTILVFGGSVAEQFVDFQSGGSETLLARLEGDPRFSGKKPASVASPAPASSSRSSSRGSRTSSPVASFRTSWSTSTA